MLRNCKTSGALLMTLCAAVTTAQADTINIMTTVRDFHEAHADFEVPQFADRGFVASDLGLDKTPVYVGPPGGTHTTSGPDNFAQWYHDVPDVNLKTNVFLPFDNGKPEPGGTYSYSNDAFFPIDNALFGNEGHNHNYHFTLEMHTSFVYQPGQTATFRSDDDLFVYINNQLAVDIGGVHPQQSADLDLNSLGLTPGQTYDFDLFYAERRTVKAVLDVTTNIQFIPEPGTLGLLAIGGLACLRRRGRGA